MNSNILNAGYDNKFRVSRAKKQFIYDNKNNKFLDLSMSAGVLILGHSSKVFNNSINFQKKKGSLFGLPNIYTDKYSRILKRIFPSFSKFVLSSTGSEANLRAIRIARAITNKEKIVMVSGSWHGSIDSLLFDLKLNKIRALSSGLSKYYYKNIIIIPYNNYLESIKILKKNLSNIALVIIEPIQQNIPTQNSEKYVEKIYNFCKKKKNFNLF